MTARTLLASAALLAVVCGAGRTQPAASKPSPAKLPPVTPALPSSPAPKGQALDQMLDALEQLRAEKAELEKKEQALVAAIRLKLDKQTERVNRLGVGSPPVPQPVVLDPVVPGIPTTGTSPAPALPLPTLPK